MSNSDNQSADIVVPDIGDSVDVEVIEILVSVGDSVSVDDSLLTLESDKASMEIPATQAGVVESLSVSIGDTVNVGDVIGKMSLIAGPPGASPPSETVDTEKDTDTESAPPSSATTSADGADTQKPMGRQAEPEKTASPPSTQKASSPTAHISDDNIRKAHASPGVRRYAREHHGLH